MAGFISVRKNERPLLNQKGVALVLVLWVTVLLTVIVNGFILMVRTEAWGVSNYKDEISAYYHARSGLNIALDKLGQDGSVGPGQGAQSELQRWVFDGRPYRVALEDGFVEVRIADENGKLDINKATRSDLLRLFIAFGIKGSERDIIVDSILDWVDDNNFHRLNGAEDDYYGSLSEPYGAKDGPFDTLDELMWVKGVIPELFFGKGSEGLDAEGEKGERVGLEDLLTVYSATTRVNVNTAPFKVLVSIPGIGEEAARKIIGSRGHGEIQNVGELVRDGVALDPSISKYITFASPGVYTIESTGRYDNGRVRHSLKAVVRVNKKVGHRILYWQDQARVKRGI
jgi:general secretion pathway protein K